MVVESRFLFIADDGESLWSGNKWDFDIDNGPGAPKTASPKDLNSITFCRFSLSMLLLIFHCVHGIKNVVVIKEAQASAAMVVMMAHWWIHRYAENSAHRFLHLSFWCFGVFHRMAIILGISAFRVPIKFR